MTGSAFTGGDFDPKATIPRLTNYDLVRPGSSLYKRLQEIIRDVNVKIAPAAIHDRFALNDSARALEFRGRWGTFRVSFMVADHMLDQVVYAPERFAYEIEGMMGTAIHNALRDLVRTEMRHNVEEGTTAVIALHEADVARFGKSIAALTDRVAELETPWWTRLQRWLRGLERFNA